MHTETEHNEEKRDLTTREEEKKPDSDVFTDFQPSLPFTLNKLK